MWAQWFGIYEPIRVCEEDGLEWLNYHHLLYFWTVAREGSVTAACEELRLAPSTVSGQIHQLEDSLGQKLFQRSGRNLVLTDFGHNVFRYADEIFTIGRELMDFVHGRPVGGPIRLDVGVTEVVPKLVVRKLIEPGLEHEEGVHLTIREGHSDELLADLALHHLDVVITDAPAGPDTRVRAFNHLLGECDVAVFGTDDLADIVGDDFPASLHGVPILLPTSNAVLRRLLDQWFDQRDIHPMVVAEFQDAAQLKSFGEHGMGVFPAPDVVADEIERQYAVRKIGVFEGIREKFYAVSVERKLKHPCVVALFEAARGETFGE